MPKWMRISDVWRAARAEWARIDGTWRSAINGYVKIDGVWRMGGISPFYGSLLPGNGVGVSYSNFSGGTYRALLITFPAGGRVGFQILPRELITLPCTVTVNWTISNTANEGTIVDAFVGGITTAAGNNNAAVNGTAFRRRAIEWEQIAGTYTDTIEVVSAPQGIGVGLYAYTSVGQGSINLVVNSITINGLPVKLE